MARINIEDGFWSDDRFLSLIEKIGNRAMAAGALLIAIKTAQKYWVPNRRPIPVDKFRMIPCHAEIIFCGLAEEVDGGEFVYIKGSETHFGWILQRSSAGKKGGPAAAKKRTPKHDIIDDLEQRDTTGHDGTRPLTLPPTLSLKTNTNTNTSNAHSVRFDFEAAYKKYPRKEGKTRGMKLCEREIKISADYNRLLSAISNYTTLCNKEQREKKHIMHFDTFMGCWTDYESAQQNTQPPFQEISEAEREKRKKEMINNDRTSSDAIISHTNDQQRHQSSGAGTPTTKNHNFRL